MDEKRKIAYRKILYNFLIQIKQMEIPHDISAINIGRYAAPVAYALHNFALASANDFVNFDEVAFWRMLDAWDARFPELGFSGFRKMFEWDLAQD
ncbi:hypothetical protein [Hymenobacter sp. BRD67]|uniref:hypothetical protein n=1 Tax=Hymenobacter sp. BRD67 TaxID=2675877 RepID=UPI0015646866|nr:hypothetical protein [Hymenobacter sp. BRD67]QKG53699.1 hypothetical protein GKZ67_15205 [Hymenobacter sp. BRD67]